MTALRTEAVPFRGSDLDARQQDALRKTIAALKVAVDGLKISQSDSLASAATPFLRHARLNQTVFIDGGRGAGKTTVLLAMMREAQEALKKQDEAARRLFEPSLHKRIVWLDPLDLELEPESFSGLSSLVARVEQAIRRLDRGVREHDERLARVLDDAKVDAVLSSSDMNAHRAARVDPEEYAREQYTNAQARLRLFGNLHELLERASQLKWPDGIENPLFVLAIDDFDLAPWHCVEVLRVLRMLSLPRLFTIVLGRYDLLVEMEELNIRGALRRRSSAGGNSLLFVEEDPYLPESSLLDRELRSVFQLASETAREAARKLIPRAQCFRIGPERSDPPNWNFKVGGQGLTLAELLRGVSAPPHLPRADAEATPNSLLEVLGGPSEVPAGEQPKPSAGPTEEGLTSTGYLGRDALVGPARRLNDLCSSLLAERPSNDGTQPEGRSWAKVVDEIALWALEGESHPARMSVLEWLRDNPADGNQAEGRPPFSFACKANDAFEIRPTHGRLVLQRTGRWLCRPDSLGSEYFDSTTAGALALRVDSAPLPRRMDWVLIDDPGVVRFEWRTGIGAANFEVLWPVQPWFSVLEAQIDLAGVDRASRVAMESSTDRDRQLKVERVWLVHLIRRALRDLGGEARSELAVLDQLLRKPDELGAQDALEAPLQSALRKVLSSPRSEGRLRPRERLLVALALWLAPECGVLLDSVQILLGFEGLMPALEEGSVVRTTVNARKRLFSILEKSEPRGRVARNLMYASVVRQKVAAAVPGLSPLDTFSDEKVRSIMSSGHLETSVRELLPKIDHHFLNHPYNVEFARSLADLGVELEQA